MLNTLNIFIDLKGRKEKIKNQDCFDENDDEIQRLLEEKHRLHKVHHGDTSSVSKKAAFSNICETVQTKLRGMQDSCLRKKTITSTSNLCFGLKITETKIYTPFIPVLLYIFTMDMFY